MEELLVCRCGHGISSHSATGCDGARFRPCRCGRSRNDVLDAAIRDVRTEFGPPLKTTDTYAPGP